MNVLDRNEQTAVTKLTNLSSGTRPFGVTIKLKNVLADKIDEEEPLRREEFQNNRESATHTLTCLTLEYNHSEGKTAGKFYGNSKWICVLILHI